MVVLGKNRSAGPGWPWRLGLRLAGAGLLAAAGAIHLDLYLTGYRTIPTIGWLFLLQDGGIRTAALHRLAGTVTASRCCPEVPAPQPQPPRTSPDDLAAEANPQKTELNPHKAVEAASRARTDQPGLPSPGQSPPARQLAKAEPSRRLRSAVPITLRYHH